MSIREEDVLLRVFTGETQTVHGRALYEAIVLEARRIGIAGATVIRGVYGYGASRKLHSAKLVELTEDLPVIVEMVDTIEMINEMLPWLDANLKKGFVTMEKVFVKRFPGNQETSL
jgi:hypothetical protein